MALYHATVAVAGDGACARYNALRGQLVSFLAALEADRARARR